MKTGENNHNNLNWKDKQEIKFSKKQFESSHSIRSQGFELNCDLVRGENPDWNLCFLWPEFDSNPEVASFYDPMLWFLTQGNLKFMVFELLMWGRARNAITRPTI